MNTINESMALNAVPGRSPSWRGAARSLVGSCIAMFLSPSSMLLISFGIYVGPIVADTGWDRTAVAGAVGPALIIAGLMSPVVGWATNRLGPRRFITLAFPAFGVAMMLIATSTSAGMLMLLLALAGVLVSGNTVVPFAYCVSGWYEARRGMALGTMLAFTGVGLAVIPPLAVYLLGQIGWRATFLSLGLVTCVVGLLVARLLIVDPPVATASREDVPGVRWQKALTMPAFWFLTIAIALLGGSAAGGMVNLYEVLVGRGVQNQSASLILSVVGVSLICARLFFGYLFDRFSAHRVMVVICLVMSSAFVVLVTTDGPAGVVVAAILIGIGFGAEGDALSYMTSRLFGMRDFAKIFGIEFLAFTFGGGSGPALFAMAKGRTGDHETALWCAAGACAVAAVLTSFIRKRDLAFGRRGGPEARATPVVHGREMA